MFYAKDDARYDLMRHAMMMMRLLYAAPMFSPRLCV